ncbi:MAG TPA: Uma2 family endonuclease [Gemmataceae bacterium]|jgi:hypothetical protein|nr:Uma2 family endonuclease [Gemmataceae bacterium]
MSSATRQHRRPPDDRDAELANGDRMQQEEFHRKYEAYPEDAKFELIAGTVYMASPLRQPHGAHHFLLNWLLGIYTAETPGVEGLDNATILLDKDNEPQPDLTLRVLPEFGGNTSLTPESYVKGAPELICEIAHSTRAIDLHQKKNAYRKAGVGEYLVLSIEEGEVAWFDFKARRAIIPNPDGISKSRIFPGLWLLLPALIARGRKDLMATLRSGLQSPEHAAFVKRMNGRRERKV